jgi:rhodanese-related sulfurtransferase/nucleotide-binding universal stress UspA family protein
MFSILKNMFKKEKESDHYIIKNAALVDVRSKSEYASGHLEGAINIPLEQVDGQVDKLKAFPQVVVYCRSGNRSAHAKKILIDHGIKNVVDGGSLANVQTLATISGFNQVELVVENEPRIPHSELKKNDKDVLKVLIPTDFSVQAEYSYLMVRKLEENLSVDIHFLHVLDLPDTVSMDQHGNIETCGEIDAEFVKSQKQIVDRKLKNLQLQYGKHINVHLVLGKITDNIISFAENNHFDLIVMGTKGAWGVKEKLTSSQAQIIARRSMVPLLSLMCDRSDLIIKDILYVHDFRDADTHQLPLMEKFSKYFDAVYHQLYIQASEVQINESEMLDLMDKYASKHQLGNHKNHIVQAKNVEDGVNHFIAGQDVDMVFIGTHGKGGIFHNSAAENLIKHLFKPIISFHL